MVRIDQLDKCVQVARRFKARRLVLFGSAAETPETARDIDLICEGVSGVDFLRMGAEMENETGIVVDVVPAEGRSAFVEYNLPRGRVLYDAGRTSS